MKKQFVDYEQGKEPKIIEIKDKNNMEPKIIEIEINNEIFTAILVEDTNIGGYTGFLKEKPEVVAEGDGVGETIVNLKNIFKDVKEYENK